jgi:hypothetical protein
MHGQKVSHATSRGALAELRELDKLGSGHQRAVAVAVCSARDDEA